MKDFLTGFLIATLILGTISCVTSQKQGDGSKADEENREFLKSSGKGGETFRVLLTSDEYKVVQLKYDKTMQRLPDENGDKYISSEIHKLNMIDEARVGVISVWLYPDSGKIMKIRSQRPIYFKEVDSLLNDDIMRWNLSFPKKVIEPTKFDIIYRVVIRKKQSDEEIIKVVQDRMKDGG